MWKPEVGDRSMRTDGVIGQGHVLHHVAVIVVVCSGVGLGAPADSPAGAEIALTGFERTGTALELRYEIANLTDHDVWLCDNICVPYSPPIETFLDVDGETLVVRRRFGVPQEVLLNLSYWQEGVIRNRQEEFEVFYKYACTKNEPVLRIELDGVSIPYTESVEPEVLGLPIGDCTRIEIRYEPSVLAYCFPDQREQDLLSETEREYLESLETIEITDRDDIWALAGSLGGDYGPVTFTGKSRAEVVGYRESERIVSLTVYRRALITADGHPFYRDEGFAALREITPQVQPFEMRMQCAYNLDDWWYRFRLYHVIRGTQTDYPVPSQWCDDMATALRTAGWRDDWLYRPMTCPATDAHDCGYAMNPQCRRGSPAETVLLFETEPGWNRHGGPELFAFGNHDPKGGCVLLNDGTVTFIRTEEELQALRWQ